MQTGWNLGIEKVLDSDGNPIPSHNCSQKMNNQTAKSWLCIREWSMLSYHAQSYFQCLAIDLLCLALRPLYRIRNKRSSGWSIQGQHSVILLLFPGLLVNTSCLYLFSRKKPQQWLIPCLILLTLLKSPKSGRRGLSLSNDVTSWPFQFHSMRQSPDRLGSCMAWHKGTICFSFPGW